MGTLKNLSNRKFSVSLLLLLAFLLFLGCDRKRKNADPFYIDKGEFDYSRIPLIKPYQVATVIPPGEFGWIVSSIDSTGLPETIPGAKFVNVIDSVIFVCGKNTILNGLEVPEAWFILIPKQAKLYGFKTRKEYLKCLDSLKIEDPRLFETTEVFQHFDWKDTLDWKELNRTYMK